jgi:LacI family sucrose operon transcriptional repressor
MELILLLYSYFICNSVIYEERFDMTTLRDVAVYVGVSTATVSRVLNGTGSISKKTKQKVYEAIRELNYIPNDMARSLACRSNSRIIGLIVPYINHNFFSTLTAAIEDSCYKNGYRLFLCTSGGHADRELELLNALKANRVAGILVCSRIEDSSCYTNLDIPLVSIERTFDGIPSVSCDNYRGGILAAQELFDAGCRHMLLVGNRYDQTPYLPAFLRYKGFLEKCTELKADCFELYLEKEDLFGQGLVNSLMQTMKAHPDMDGIFATSDILAVQVMHLINSKIQGSSVQRIRIIGFDGLSISEYNGITTIAQPITDMGEMAVDVLIRKINHELIPERSILPISLIRRQSTQK